MDRPQFIKQIIEWLRVGYPDGIPENDYVPLFAILALKLRDKDIKAIADSIKEAAGDKQGKKGKKIPIEADKANKIISDTLGVVPTELDLQRVRAKLRKKGVNLEIKPADEA